MIRLSAQLVTLDAAAPDGEPKRTITGLAVPWDTTATLSGGEVVQFLKGSISEDASSVKLLEFHDDTRVIGKVTALASTDEGLMFEAKIAPTRAGDDALALLAMGALDSVSVGAIPVRYKTAADGTMLVSEARMVELSVVTVPAYAEAQVYSVAASATEESVEEDATQPNPTQDSEEENMDTQETPVEAAIATTPIYATAKREFKMPTAAEYIAKFVAGGGEFAEFNARIKAAAPEVVLSDLPGTLPTPIVQPYFDSLNPIRPTVTAIGTRAMPATGATFRRPVLTTRPVADVQANDGDTLNASTVVIANNNVDKVTVGTYANLTEQTIDWSDPSSIDIVLRQMAIAYGQATDLYACSELEAGVSQNEDWNSGDAAATIAGIYLAAATISGNGNYLPTHAFVAPDVWAKLGGLCDDSGRPVFPSLAPMNAAGVSSAATWNGNPLGLELVVDKNFTAGTFIVGHAAGPAAGFEIYENNRGAVSIDLPSTLQRQVAYRGFIATFMADATMFVKMDDQA